MKSLLLSIFLLATTAVFAQDPDKTVSLKASGSGTTQEQAKNNALRSAVEQAYGAFISSKTEILNDQVVADEIVSVASGNIQAFKILEEQHTDSLDFCLLEAVVSISKLTSFAQSKGYAVEVQGGMFAINIKQKLLNESAEVVAMRNALTTAQELMLHGFDYSVKTKEPVVNDALKGDWKIGTEVWSVTNANYQKAEEIIKSTLKNIALTPQELNEYKSLGKKTYMVKYHHESGEIKEFNLRTSEALWALIRLTFKIPSFTQLFILSDGVKPDIYGIEADCAELLNIAYPRQVFNQMIHQYEIHKGMNSKFAEPGRQYEKYSNRTPLRKILYNWDNYSQHLPLLHVNILDYYEFNSSRVLTQSSINLIYTTDEIQKLNNISAAPVSSENIFQNIRTNLKPDIPNPKYINRKDEIYDQKHVASHGGRKGTRPEKFLANEPIVCCYEINNSIITKHFEDHWKLWYRDLNSNVDPLFAYETKMRPGTYCVQIIYASDLDGRVIAFIVPGEFDGISKENDHHVDPSSYPRFCPHLSETRSPFGDKINQKEYKIISQYITEESKKINNYPVSTYSFQEYSDSEKFEMKARDARMEYLFIHVY